MMNAENGKATERNIHITNKVAHYFLFALMMTIDNGDRYRIENNNKNIFKLKRS